MATQAELVERRQTQRVQDKALVPRYLAAAKTIADRYESIVEAGEYISVGTHVKQMDDGAFVEAIIWVPKATL